MKMRKSAAAKLMLTGALLLTLTSCRTPAEKYLSSADGRFGKGDFEGAIAYYTKVLALAPKDVNALYWRGRAWQEKEDLPKAIADFTRVLELDPEHAVALHSRGSAHNEAGNNATAIADYNKAIQLDPKIAVFYYNRGNAYDDLGVVKN